MKIRFHQYKQDGTKTDSECATQASQRKRRFVCARIVMHNGGISAVFRAFIVKCFKRVRAQHAFEFVLDITTVVEFATQMITTAIVNAVGTYVVRNMRRGLTVVADDATNEAQNPVSSTTVTTIFVSFIL